MKNLNEYPTPITDELSNSRIGPWKYALPIDHSIDLERKLAACREFIRDAIDYSHIEEMHKPSAEELLAATAP